MLGRVGILISTNVNYPTLTSNRTTLGMGHPRDPCRNQGFRSPDAIRWATRPERIQATAPRYVRRIIHTAMTTEEHNLLILMLARINQAIGAFAEVLKSRDIVTQDDLKAFHFAAWDDDRQILKAVIQARSDYLRIAKQAGVEVPPEI